MKPRTSIVATLAIGLLIAACSSTPTAAPATPSPVPSGAPSAAASSGPATPTPSSTPVTTPAPSAAPSALPTPAETAFDYKAAEQRLIDALRVDARVNCAPRRANLPDFAIAGVECRVGTALVDRVGVYGFAGHLDSSGKEVGTALQAYLARLDAAGIKPGTGDCTAGKAGDRSWPDYLPDEGDSGGLRAERSGCFIDAGTANVRLTCYDDIYMGVLGKTTNIAALYDWAWKVASNQRDDRDPPGLCNAPD
jgi:hypothetical protein